MNVKEKLSQNKKKMRQRNRKKKKKKKQAKDYVKKENKISACYE